MEIILELILELVINLVAELGVRGYGRGKEAPKRVGPAQAIFGYTVLAVVLGGLSLLLFPHHFIGVPALRAANLLFTPLMSGVLLGLWGRLLARQGKHAIRLDSFVYGFVFALAFGLVRYFFAT